MTSTDIRKDQHGTHPDISSGMSLARFDEKRCRTGRGKNIGAPCMTQRPDFSNDCGKACRRDEPRHDTQLQLLKDLFSMTLNSKVQKFNSMTACV